MEVLQAFIQFFVDLFTAIGILTSSFGNSSFNFVDLAAAFGAVGNLAQGVENQVDQNAGNQ